MAARRKKTKLVTLAPEDQADSTDGPVPGWQEDNKLPEAYRPPVPHVHVKDYHGGPVCPKCFAPRKLPHVHTSSTQRSQTFNGWLVTAIAVVSAVIGALFGGLALHP